VHGWPPSHRDRVRRHCSQPSTQWSGGKPFFVHPAHGLERDELKSCRVDVCAAGRTVHHRTELCRACIHRFAQPVSLPRSHAMSSPAGRTSLPKRIYRGYQLRGLHWAMNSGTTHLCYALRPAIIGNRMERKRVTRWLHVDAVSFWRCSFQRRIKYLQETIEVCSDTSVDFC
jgi:hypothetical protein